MLRSLASPCQKACALDTATGRCRGCLRTGHEIFYWATLSADEQAAAIRRLARDRAARRRRKARRLAGLETSEA